MGEPGYRSTEEEARIRHEKILVIVKEIKADYIVDVCTRRHFDAKIIVVSKFQRLHTSCTNVTLYYLEGVGSFDTFK